jgi:hypothetical protein
MIAAFASSFFNLSLRDVLIGVALFVLSIAITLGALSFVLVKLPADYFQQNGAREFFSDKPAWVRLAAIVGKNLLGIIFVLVGIVMSIPGVPGQGFLTILLGVILLDFPGKRRIELWFASRPPVFRGINSLRQKFGKPPFVLD